MVWFPFGRSIITAPLLTTNWLKEPIFPTAEEDEFVTAEPAPAITSRLVLPLPLWMALAPTYTPTEKTFPPLVINNWLKSPPAPTSSSDVIVQREPASVTTARFPRLGKLPA